MTLLERFEALLQGDETETEAKQEEEQLTAEERRALEHARKEQMRRDLLEAGYGGVRTDVFSDR